jgi:PD-(D/E)XK nuclease superfamily
MTTKRQYFSQHGLKLPGVTEVIKDPGDELDLLYWAGKVAIEHGTPMAASRLRDEAAAQGTAVHEALDQMVKGLPQENNAATWRAFRVWHEIKLCWPLDPIDSEVAITSTAQPYGGTIDLIVWPKSGPVIVDLKTGNHLDKGSVLLQLGGYRALLRERDGVAADLAVLWAPRADNTRTELIELTREQADLAEQGFIAALGRYVAVQQLSKAVRFPRLAKKALTPKVNTLEEVSDAPF